MERLPRSSVLQFHPDTLAAVRRACGLDRPGDMARAVDILEEWVQQQPHFTKKDFSREYLEIAIINSKGSVERAKQRLDRLCTFRTTMPQYFVDADLQTDFKELRGMGQSFYLPRLTEDHYRVFMIRVASLEITPKIALQFYALMIMRAEYKIHDYVNGYILMFDYSKVNLSDLLRALDLTILHQYIQIITKGYDTRLKALYAISESKLVHVLVGMVKQVLSPKMSSRIQVLESAEALQQFLPRCILPAEYGGEERSCEELFKEWIEELNSAENRAYRREMNAARVDEALRPADSTRDNTGMGVPGTFRALTVD